MAVAATVALFSALGCRQDMQDEPKFFPQRGTSFYADGRSVRPQVENTVGRNQLREDSYFYTGLSGGKEGDGMPFPVTMDVLARGQERYNVYCTPCHSRVGNGAGMIVERGYAHAGNYHTARLETAPLGHFFNVISNGYGAMPDYSAQVTPADRWAIVAYIKALQLSQHATQADVPAGAHVQSLSSIAESEGLPANFATDWVVPSMTPIPEQKALPLETQPVAPAAQVSPKPAQESPKPISSNTAAPVASGTPKAMLKTVAASEAKASPEAGHEVYTSNCQVCHQANKTGIPPNIPGLVGIVDRVGEARIRSVVKNGISTGKPPMPSFTLSAVEMDNLIAFLSKTDKPGAKPSSFTRSNKNAVMSLASAKR